MAVCNGLGAILLANVITDIDNGGTYTAVGTGITPASATDTTLQTEVARTARQDHSTTSSSVTISGYVTATQANGNTITEVGVLTAAIAGTLYNHDIHTAIIKTSAIEIWYDLTFNVAITLNT